MNRHLRLRSIVGLSLFALAMTATLASAQSPLGNPFGASSAGYTPAVPVSQFARPWLDPSRFHVSSMVSVGTGFSGTTSALQVTSLQYQFTKPMWLSVSVGNSLGTKTFRGSGNNLFLEGLSFGFRPTANSVFQVQYRDMRSPLQYTSDPFFGSRW